MSERPEPKVRVGVPDDLDAMMTIAMMATEENAVIAPSPQKLLEDIYPALHLHYGIVGIVGEPGDQIEGAVLLRIGPLWYADEQPIIEEKAVFVHPDYRAARGSRAKALIQFSKQVSDTLGIPLMMGVMSTQRTAAKMRLYERQFGEPAGVYFLYGASTGQPKAA